MARRPIYQCVTGEITSALTTGVKENLTLFKPATSRRTVRVISISANLRVVQTAGSFAWELQYISAENGTPGGTSVTAQPLYLPDPASDCVCRQVVTGAPTVTGVVFERTAFPLPAAATPHYNPIVIFDSKDRDDFEDAIVFAGSAAHGLRITQNVIAALTTAPIFTLEVQYIESE